MVLPYVPQEQGVPGGALCRGKLGVAKRMMGFQTKQENGNFQNQTMSLRSSSNQIRSTPRDSPSDEGVRGMVAACPQESP